VPAWALLNLLALLNDVDRLRWFCGVEHQRIRFLPVSLRLLLCSPCLLLSRIRLFLFNRKCGFAFLFGLLVSFVLGGQSRASRDCLKTL